MKRIFFIALTLLSVSTYAQSYSSYYGHVDVNQKVEIDATVDKTIKTIDYGALAAANAQKEANRLNRLKYTDARDAQRAKEIAEDPYMAYTYGEKFNQKIGRLSSFLYLRPLGHAGRRISWSFVKPNRLLFSEMQLGAFRNSSPDGKIECVIHVGMVFNYNKYKKDYPEWNPAEVTSARELTDFINDEYQVGQIKKIEGENCFIHKQDLSRATVYGNNGYLTTMAYESDFEKVILDNYTTFDDGIVYYCIVKYSVDKRDGDFEDLEGRRHYLKRLGEEIIASAQFYYY